MGWLRLPLRAMVYAFLVEALTLVVYYGLLLAVVLAALLAGLLPGDARGAGLVLMVLAAPFLKLAIHLPEWLAMPWSLYLQDRLAGLLTQGNLLDPLIRAAFWWPPLTLNALLLLVVHRVGRFVRPSRESP
ncbi:MAG TPA: hypothetical protein VKA55_11655 [Gammaproteobacteria bacterium]|nr:hypothetical protein [Gammaproteobacteria bacterium]